MKRSHFLIIIICCLTGWGAYYFAKLCFSRAYYNRGIALAKNELYEESISFYEKAIKWEPRYVEAWCSKAIAFFRLGKYDEALKAVERATELAPDYPFVWNSKAWLLETLGRKEEAKEAYKRMAACKKSRAAKNKIKL